MLLPLGRGAAQLQRKPDPKSCTLLPRKCLVVHGACGVSGRLQGDMCLQERPKAPQAPSRRFMAPITIVTLSTSPSYHKLHCPSDASLSAQTRFLVLRKLVRESQAAPPTQDPTNIGCVLHKAAQSPVTRGWVPTPQDRLSWITSSQCCTKESTIWGFSNCMFCLF